MLAAGRPVDLTKREYELLLLLARSDGRVLPREDIYQRVWGYAMARGDRSVDVFVRKVRHKLEAASPGLALRAHALRHRLPLRPGAAMRRESLEPTVAAGRQQRLKHAAIEDRRRRWSRSERAFDVGQPTSSTTSSRPRSPTPNARPAACRRCSRSYPDEKDLVRQILL